MDRELNNLVKITSNQLEVIRTNDFVEFINQIGFYGIDNVKTLFNNFDIENITDDRMVPIFLAGKARIFSLEGNFLAAKMHIDNALEQAKEQNRRLTDSTKDDVYAYVNYEAGLLHRLLLDLNQSEIYFSETQSLSQSSKLIDLVKYQREVLRVKNDKSRDLTSLEKIVSSFKMFDMHIMYILGMHRLGTIYRTRKQNEKARNCYEVAEDLSKSHNYNLLNILTKNSHAFLDFNLGKVDRALGVFDDLFEGSISYYLKAIISENIALVYYKLKEYNLSVDYCYKALSISMDNHVLSQIPDECLFLGEVYNKNLNKPQKAKYFYKLGYDQALFQVGHGLNLIGSREEAVNKYVDFLQNYFPERQDSEIPGHLFDFALNKEWQEIKDIFQYNLVVFHKLETKPEEDMFGKLNMKPTTYYSLQAKLAKKGFAFPDFRKKEIQFAGDMISESLQGYIRNMKDITWEAANKSFEKDMFRFLFKKYGYQKTKLSKVLNLSYPVVVARTKELTQSIELYKEAPSMRE